jgi:hypothetical protein
LRNYFVAVNLSPAATWATFFHFVPSFFVLGNLMANPVATINRSGHELALSWAQQNLSAGVDSEVLVNGLLKQGWPEYDARMILDNALTRPTAPPLPVARQVNRGFNSAPNSATGPVSMVNYASARPAGQQAYQTAIKDAHRNRMLIGAGIFGIGIVITIVSLAASASTGGTYFLCYGPIIVGGYRMVTGFIGWVSN